MSRPAELALVLVLGWLLAADAAAQASSLTSEVTSAILAVGRIYAASRDAIVALSIVAILGMGVAAYFGRFPWKWFWTLSGGLFLIGVGAFALNEFLKPAHQLGTAETIQLGTSIFGSRSGSQPHLH